jgi:hypothetical protein
MIAFCVTLVWLYDWISQGLLGFMAVGANIAFWVGRDCHLGQEYQAGRWPMASWIPSWKVTNGTLDTKRKGDQWHPGYQAERWPMVPWIPSWQMYNGILDTKLRGDQCYLELYDRLLRRWQFQKFLKDVECINEMTNRFLGNCGIWYIYT